MKKDTITVSMDSEKLRATRRYMGKKDADLEQELGDQLQKMYEKYVPTAVREFIDEGDEDNALAPAMPKKQKEKTGVAASAPQEVHE